MQTNVEVCFFVKLLSNGHYLEEVSVEKKKSSRYLRRLCLYDLYTRLIIRNGNCITFLSQPITMTASSFWDPLQFEGLVKYVFWTFGNGFCFLVANLIHSLSLNVINRSLEVLQAYPVAFDEQLGQDADEELLWCLQKNRNLKKDNRYELMYRLDRENRTVLSEKLWEASKVLAKERDANEQSVTVILETSLEPSTFGKENSIPFLHLLKPIKQNISNTLNIIQESLISTEFTFDLFAHVVKTSNGKNPQGLNGQIAAMIDFFFQQNYFVAGVSIRQIFTEYFQFSGNRIPKLGHYYAQFRADPTYIRYFSKLKALKISKL